MNFLFGIPVLSWYLVPFWRLFLDLVTYTPQHNHKYTIHTLFCDEKRMEGNDMGINAVYFWLYKIEDVDPAYVPSSPFPNG